MERRSIAWARQVMASDADGMTDAEIGEMLDAAYSAAEMFLMPEGSVVREAAAAQLRPAIYPRRPRKPRTRRVA